LLRGRYGSAEAYLLDQGLEPREIDAIRATLSE
jgi:hypothetical protein